jgi:hypothetical protein
MKVVEQEEAERMLLTGVWFDSPLEAKQYRAKVEDEIKQESKPSIVKAIEKPKGNKK